MNNWAMKNMSSPAQSNTAALNLSINGQTAMMEILKSIKIVCVAGVSDANIPATTGVTIATGGQAIVGQIIDGNAWAPMVAVCNALGIKYAWNGATRTMTLL